MADKHPALDGEAPRARLEVEELEQKLMAEISLMLLVAGGLLTCLFPADSPRLWGHFAVFLSLLVEGLLCYALRRKAPLLARAVLILGPTLSLVRALQLMAGPALPCLAVLIVVANFAVDPLAGLLAAMANTVSIAALIPRELAALPLILIWCAAAVEWLLARELHTALMWSENSQQRAVRLLIELRERQGQLNRTLTALTEATRRLERTNQELAVARRHAEEARSLKEQFVANVSHELRTPLNLIVGFAEMMYLAPETYEGVSWTSELESDIGRLYRASRHLQSLVDDILDLSRIDAGRLPMFRELYDVRPVIAEAVETISPLLQQRHLWHRIEWPDELPQLFVDRTRIRQVLLNLLNNAARYTDAGGITIRVELTPEGVVVCVQDTGIGLGEDQLARIFDKFHQAHGTRRRGGTGLGLTLSRQFVELHGGRMWVESRPGVGSSFYFLLPLPGTLPVSAALHYLPARAEVELSHTPIVVVDPDPEVAEMLSRYLGDRPLLAARDLGEAEALVEAEHPLAVLVNEMPDTPAEGGPYALHALGEHATRYNVPVFHCSIPSPSWLVRSSGFSGCLTKPVSLASLKPVLERHCSEPGTILLVDDDAGFVSLIARMLRTTTFAREVLSAYSGPEAVRLARERVPCLVLLDLLMPEMDGFDVLRALRESPGLERMAVVAVTATSYAEEAIVRAGGSFMLTQARGISTGTVAELLNASLRLVGPSYVGEESAASST